MDTEHNNLEEGLFVKKGAIPETIIVYCYNGAEEYNHIVFTPPTVLALINFCQTKMGWKFMTDQNMIEDS